MSIQWNCLECGAPLEASVAQAGESTTCPKCGAHVHIPHSSFVDEFTKSGPRVFGGSRSSRTYRMIRGACNILRGVAAYWLANDALAILGALAVDQATSMQDAKAFIVIKGIIDVATLGFAFLGVLELTAAALSAE